MSGLRLQLAGLSLVELLISLLLASILSLSISGVYLQSLKNYRAELELARMQDNGRYALGLLRHELTHAGFFAGAVDAAQIPSTAISLDCVEKGDWALDIVRPLDFIDDFSTLASKSPHTTLGVALGCLVGDDIRSGTDIVSVKRLAGNFTLRDGAYLPSGRLKNAQWYLRFEHASGNRNWFYHKRGGLPSTDIGSNTRVDYWEYLANIFYVRKFSETSSDSVPALCVESLSGGGSLGKMTTHCLVEGVEDMQLEFGVDEDFDGAPDYFRAKPTSAEFTNSMVVRLHLLMRSVAEIPGYARQRRFHLGEKQIVRKDGYLRQVLSATVNLPNLQLSQQ